jgi:spore coat polysaccharide biosynthesis protein SpsF
MPIGSAVDVVDVDVLQELNELGETHPIALPRENPDEWRVEVTTNERLERYSEAHFAVDTPEDYWTLTDAVDAVGSDTSEILKWISEKE